MPWQAIGTWHASCCTFNASKRSSVQRHSTCASLCFAGHAPMTDLTSDKDLACILLHFQRQQAFVCAGAFYMRFPLLCRSRPHDGPDKRQGLGTHPTTFPPPDVVSAAIRLRHCHLTCHC